MPNQILEIEKEPYGPNAIGTLRALCKEVGFKPDAKVVAKLRELDQHVAGCLERLNALSRGATKEAFLRQHQHAAATAKSGEATPQLWKTRAQFEEDATAQRQHHKHAMRELAREAAPVAERLNAEFREAAVAHLDKMEADERKRAERLAVPFEASPTLANARKALRILDGIVPEPPQMLYHRPASFCPWLP